MVGTMVYFVPIHWACPHCGQRELDKLDIDRKTGAAWCTRCGCRYECGPVEGERGYGPYQYKEFGY